MGRLKEIHDAGINRSAERWCPHHAAHRGSLNVPALPAGSRVERNALTPRAGTDRAIPLLERAIELEPGNYFPRGVIGVTLTQVGRTDEAISHTRASMRLSPYYPDWLLYTLAQAFIVSGNYEEALPATVTLVDRTKATWTGPLLWLAVIHYDEGRFDESKEAVTRAVEADPNLTSVTDIGNHNFTDPSIMRRWRAIWVEMGMPEE